MDNKHFDPELRLAAHMAFALNPERTVHQLGLPHEMISHIVPDGYDFEPADSDDADSDADADDIGAAAVADDTVDGKPTTTIADLNDDCLLMIYQHLDLIDIVHASEAVRGLSEFAVRNIYQNFSKLSMNDYFGDMANMGPLWPLLMQHLGPHLHELVLNNTMLRHGHIRPVVFVLQYCTELRVLRVENFSFDGPKDIELLLQIKHFVPERLELFMCTGMTVRNGFDKVLEKFVNLRSLTIQGDSANSNTNEFNVNMLKGLHGLERLVMGQMHDTDNVLSRVLANQGGNLQRLTMIDLGPVNLDLLCNISTYSPNLVELKLHIGPQPSVVHALHKLRHLQRLQLVDDSSRNAGNELWYLQPFKQLEWLELSMFHADLLDAVRHVPTLKTLSARCPRIRTDETIFTTVAGLPNLTSLQLCSFKFGPSAPIRLLRSNANLCEMTLDRCLTKNPPLKEIVDHLTALHDKNWRLPFKLTIISEPPVYWETEWGVLSVDQNCLEDELNIKPVLQLKVQFSRSSVFTTGASPDYIMSQSERMSLRRYDIIFPDLFRGFY